MKTQTSSSSIVGLVGLAALSVYMIACTSFSPDDSKVLYPTYDSQAGDFGVGLYDRQTGKAATFFMALELSPDEPEGEPALIRPQWLADGRHILVSWGREADEDDLNLAVLPYGHSGPIRLMHVQGLDDGVSQMRMPLATARGQLVLLGESNALVCVHLLTGEISRHPMPKEVMPYATADGDRVCYLSQIDEGKGEWEMGVIDLDTWELKPVSQIKLEKDLGDDALVVVSPDGKWALGYDEEKVEVVFIENGVEKSRVAVCGEAEKVSLGAFAISPISRTAYAPYFREHEGRTNVSVGIVEFPFPRGEPRRTVLIERMEEPDDGEALYFQPSVSHDGKTLAIASTYLVAGDQQTKKDDCALFLIDLTDAERKVTRVPIEQPPTDLD